MPRVLIVRNGAYGGALARATTSVSQKTDALRHRQIDVGELSLHIVEGGSRRNRAVIFLHGWPENWTAFEPIMRSLSAEAHVVAMDLPGIGGSKGLPPSSDKRALAKCLRSVLEQLDLQDATLVGHDVGGMVVYAYLHAYADDLDRAVIMNTAIPGLEPWADVKRNPHIWHFAFHQVRALPEILVAGHEAEYFGFFFDAISAQSDRVAAESRKNYADAYSRPESLHTGFEWYRAFPQDEKDNTSTRGVSVRTPVLYLRGDHDPGEMERYLKGLHDGGLLNVVGRIIKGSGHFAPDEQPERVLTELRTFLEL